MLRNRLRKCAAFTLLEVIIVTGIIMSQANNYGDVRRLAYQKSCQNNLRQIYMGLQMYEITNGALPKAKFYPKSPKHGGHSIVKIMGRAYAEMFVCPVFPSKIKETGLTYLYNDKMGGKSIDQVQNAGKAWLLTEMNAVSDKVPMPHPGGFHTLYADGRVVVTKERPKVFVDLQKKMEEQEQQEQPQQPQS